ncbi:zinc-binding dehydrogenase [Cryobacterium sp. M15]|uniref:zinc-binding dehydrogenase n=1 Tax=Cryobacterium sp. M15 TaxID=2048291 RepID=UPI001304F2C4|nr:zinc-binding dehydrogenase [Cryobacterium sp. M15]
MEIPIPALDEFLIRVAACGVCGHDLLASNGLLSAGNGAVLGHEISGTVQSVGSPDLSGWLGTRVALVQRRSCGECADCIANHTSQCRCGPGFYGDDIQGGFAEFVLADPRNAVEIPDSIDSVTAAFLSCGVGTGLRALRAAKLKASDVVLITGASGGVGVHTVQLARHLGLRVIATTSRPSATAALVQAGATEVVVNPTVANIRAAAASLGRPRGVDAAIEVTGAPLFATSLRSLAPGGRLVLVGNVRPEAIALDPGLTIVKELQIIGTAHATRNDLVEIVDLVATGAIHPIVSHVFALIDVPQAFAALTARSSTGRAVVVP